MSVMKISHLKCFIKLTESSSYMDAAEKLHISQSSLSKIIMRLEEDLGVLLFSREGRRAELTKAGKTLLIRAKILINEHEKLIQQARQLSNYSTSNIRIGIVPIETQYNLLEKFMQLEKLHPELSIQIDEREDPSLVVGIKNGSYDMIIIREDSLFPGEFRTHNLIEDHIVVILPKTHRLSGQTTVDLSLLKNEKYFFTLEHSGTHKACVKACRTNGFEPNIVRTARLETIISSVSLGKCISLTFAHNTRAFNFAEVKLIPLEKPVISYIVLAIPKVRPISSTERIILSYLRK